MSFPAAESKSTNHQRPIPLACPTCREPFEITGLRAACTRCGQTHVCENQIWRLLRPGRERSLARWVRDYEFIRRQEGRNYRDDPSEYLALPFALPTNPRSAEWSIRSRTYRLLIDRVIGPSPLRILDLGAGNGWLSYRLAKAGHEPCAVDLTINDMDGLGAARHYQHALGRMFPRCQAEFDALPFPDDSFDLAIFNASFHYSCDYAVTLRETLRVLRVGGRVVVADSPVYHDGESGRKMLGEWHEHAEREFGVRSDAMPSLGYMTVKGMESLGRQLGIDWQHRVPGYGWRWVLKPWFARLTHRREPAQFGIWIGRSA